MEDTIDTHLQSKSIFISAGDPSGEMHGADLVNELKKKSPQINYSFSGLGGQLMKQSGVKLLYDTNVLSSIGLIDVAAKYTFFKKVLKDCLKFVQENNPDAVILIDYPGFNLKFASQLRKFYNKKIIYYISPQVWAWHEKRARIIKKYIDKMLVVFPFEAEFYKKYGVEAVYIGHPLVAKIKKFLSENSKPKKVFGKKKEITILPGSRNNEIITNLPVLLDTASQLEKEFDVNINISKAPGINEVNFNKFKKGLKNYNLTGENVYSLILKSDIVLSKAGTSTLECTLIGTPHLVFLKTKPINYFLIKPFVKINNIAIVNILAKQKIVNEFIQKDFNRHNLLAECRKLLTDNGYCLKQKASFEKIWDLFGNLDAAENASSVITSEIN